MTTEPAPTTDTPRVLVAGETLIDFLPDRPGSLATVESFERRAGGAPANVAVALQRLDEPPTLWSRVGDDQFGDFLVDRLAAAGVDTGHVVRDQTARTGLAFVAHDDDADRSFTFYRDGTADTRLEPGTVTDETLAAHDWVHVGGVTLADEPARAATFDLTTRARRADCTVSFDPNARPELWDEFDFRESCLAAFDDADVVKLTPEDAAAADLPTEPTTLARAVTEHGPHTVLVTMGSEGAVAYATPAAPWTDEGTVEVAHDGFTVDVVDTTGAGDAFTAGAIAALAGGESLAEALAFGNAVAAVTTTRTGAMTALPTRADLTSVLDRAPPEH
jgi:fructokinase